MKKLAHTVKLSDKKSAKAKAKAAKKDLPDIIYLGQQRLKS
ncbi:hypothetical protein [Pseudoalteromonas rhizosphaerae]|nr:hypothetical protein [Pseudoalteromonas rhizosphaerae]